ncbi:unnamed protein product [Nezara viridula]|uniref:Uncharacterized protein n=1 Tax=Nezara viridula TaxID=85310 RepID=A0A9P0MTR6_NEZVI|nr:unnamed protein product [Nezara viridula]
MEALIRLKAPPWMSNRAIKRIYTGLESVINKLVTGYKYKDIRRTKQSTRMYLIVLMMMTVPLNQLMASPRDNQFRTASKLRTVWDNFQLARCTTTTCCPIQFHCCNISCCNYKREQVMMQMRC